MCLVRKWRLMVLNTLLLLLLRYFLPLFFWILKTGLFLQKLKYYFPVSFDCSYHTSQISKQTIFIQNYVNCLTTTLRDRNFCMQSIIYNSMNKIKGASDMHQQLIDHYKTRRSVKHSRNFKIESIVKQTLQKKINEEDQQSPYQDFLRNEQHIATQAEPLDFRSLPRDLKVFFPGPPKPPPALKQVPYTYEMVGLVPFKMPKQKKGTVGEWVLEESSFIERRNHSVSEQKNVERYLQSHKDMTQKKKVFRKAIKQLAAKMREDNLSFSEIKKNKGLIKKPFNYYNSKQFFAMVKAGQKECQFLLQSNPYLAFDVDEFKMTPLHWAARQGHSYITKILLQKFRANTAAKDMYGRTPLHLAVAKKQIPCIIRIFIEGGQLNNLDNEKRNVRAVAPDAYTKYLLQKLEEVKFIIRAKGIRDVNLYRQELQKHVKFVLDEASLYF